MIPSQEQQPQPTERFHRVLAFAADEADGLGHGFITCQHLLYALSRETKGLASTVLDALGITADAVHDLLSESAAAHDRAEGRIDLAAEVGEALDRAAAAAHTWGHRWLDTEHILYGIASAPTAADDLFASLRLNPTDVLDRLASLQGAAPPAVVREEATHAYRMTLESAWLLSLAADTARRLGAPQVTGLHLLAALFSLESPARQVLIEILGLSPDELMRHMRSDGSHMPASVRLPLGEDVQRILGYAIGEAWNRGHLAVTPLHLAMGLARADRHAALDVLADLGVPQSELAEALIAAMPPAAVR